MIRGMYIAGTGMMLQRRLMENITNNIANADTTGYKKEHLVSHSFDDVMIERINDTAVRGYTRLVGPLSFGTQIDQLYVDYSQGGLEGTGRSTDFALTGNGGNAFFAVGTPAGERYTRNGAFYLDDMGFLVDGEGNFLLGNNGNINVGGLNFNVDQNGSIWANDEYIDTIRVVSFADMDALRKQGSNLYAGAAPIAPEEAYGVHQRFLELSNVDIAREMVDMLTVFRAYETNQRMLTMTDETLNKAVNEIGRLR